MRTPVIDFGPIPQAPPVIRINVDYGVATPSIMEAMTRNTLDILNQLR